MSARIAPAARAGSARLVLALGVSALPAAASLHAQAAWEAASCRVALGHPSAGLHAPFDALLRGFVRDGTVDYRCFQAHEAALDGYLATLARTDAGTMSRDAALALWINAYSAFTIN